MAAIILALISATILLVCFMLNHWMIQTSSDNKNYIMDIVNQLSISIVKTIPDLVKGRFLFSLRLKIFLCGIISGALPITLMTHHTQAPMSNSHFY